MGSKEISPENFFPMATITLLSASALATLLFYFTGHSELFVCFPREPWQIYGIPTLLSLFAHAGFTHLLTNSIFLFFAGNTLEARLGWKRFFLLFFLSGLAGIFGQAIVSPVGTIGASGAICGLTTATLATKPKTETKESSYFWLWVLLWLSFDLVGIQAEQSGHLGIIGHGAHIGGTLAGILLCQLPYFQMKKSSHKKLCARAA